MEVAWVFLLVGLFVAIGLVQSGPAMRERLAFGGLLFSGVVGVVAAVLAFSRSSVADISWPLFLAILAFAVVAVLTQFGRER